jgi:hypothetical protein
MGAPQPGRRATTAPWTSLRGAETLPGRDTSEAPHNFLKSLFSLCLRSSDRVLGAHICRPSEVPSFPPVGTAIRPHSRHCVGHRHAHHHDRQDLQQREKHSCSLFWSPSCHVRMHSFERSYRMRAKGCRSVLASEWRCHAYCAIDSLVSSCRPFVDWRRVLPCQSEGRGFKVASVRELGTNGPVGARQHL